MVMNTTTETVASLNCTVRLRPHSRIAFEPHQCGRLELNWGAEAVDPATQQPLLDADGQPLTSGRLFLVALRDHNGDGIIDFTGAGDEDNDGISDLAEAKMGSDPCNVDSDGDGIGDQVDSDPVDATVH